MEQLTPEAITAWKNVTDEQLLEASLNNPQAQAEVLRRMNLHRKQQDMSRIVDRKMVMLAGGLKFAAYRVLDLETMEPGPLQFHMTHNNTVLAVMSEEAAKLFNTLSTQVLEGRPLPADNPPTTAQ